jgi:hypothetical protein
MLDMVVQCSSIFRDQWQRQAVGKVSTEFGRSSATATASPHLKVTANSRWSLEETSVID